MEAIALERRGLYLITPDWNDTERLLRVVHSLLPYVSVLQYRNKTADAALQRSQAFELMALARQAKVPLIINDDIRLCEAVAADGVHLGKTDGDLRAARERLGRKAIIGASCYNDSIQAERAVASGANYVAFGAVFPSITKPEAVRAPLSLVEQVKKKLPTCVAVIGGITVDKVPDLLDAGADLICVVSDIFQAVDPLHRARQYLNAMSDWEKDVQAGKRKLDSNALANASRPAAPRAILTGQ